MIVVVQRVLDASVEINGTITARSGPGLLVLAGIERLDCDEDIDWLTKKLVNLRIFDDEQGVMNKSVKDINGDILVVSQFTLQASTRKGNRPSYINAAPPELAVPVYNKFVTELSSYFEKEVLTGEFGADMKIGLVNDGPVTIVIDSKNKK